MSAIMSKYWREFLVQLQNRYQLIIALFCLFVVVFSAFAAVSVWFTLLAGDRLAALANGVGEVPEDFDPSRLAEVYDAQLNLEKISTELAMVFLEYLGVVFLLILFGGGLYWWLLCRLYFRLHPLSFFLRYAGICLLWSLALSSLWLGAVWLEYAENYLALLYGITLVILYLWITLLCFLDAKNLSHMVRIIPHFGVRGFVTSFCVFSLLSLMVAGLLYLLSVVAEWEGLLMWIVACLWVILCVLASVSYSYVVRNIGGILQSS